MTDATVAAAEPVGTPTSSQDFQHLSCFEFFILVKFVPSPRLRWTSVNTGMFSLGRDVKNNSLDSRPEGREERTPHE